MALAAQPAHHSAGSEMVCALAGRARGLPRPHSSLLGLRSPCHRAYLGLWFTSTLLCPGPATLAHSGPSGCTGILRGFCSSACAWPHLWERAGAVSTCAQPALALLSRVQKALSHPQSSPGARVTLCLIHFAVGDTKVQKAQGGIAGTCGLIPFASLSKAP